MVLGFGLPFGCSESTSGIPGIGISRVRSTSCIQPSRFGCGSGEPGPGADVAAVSAVLVSMWQR
jgi:hypothetical protein